MTVEQERVERLTDAIITAIGIDPSAREAYLRDATFHAYVDAFAQVTANGIVGLAAEAHTRQERYREEIARIESEPPRLLPSERIGQWGGATLDG